MDELKIYNLALTDSDIKASYDADVKPPDTGDPNLTTFTFTYANQLVKAVKGSSTSYFNYDQSGGRVSKITGVHTNLYPLGGFDYESSSDPATAFTKTNYTISGDGQTSIKETISTKALQSGVFYTHTDHLGSSAITTGVEGSIRQLVDYYPFGSSHFEQSWDNYANDYKYTGKEQDEEIGLYYYGARYYDAEVGRFVSIDSAIINLDSRIFIDPQSQNSYSYARNNPIRLIDPDGKFWQETKNYLAFGVYVKDERIAELEKITLKMEEKGGLSWISQEQNTYISHRAGDLSLSRLNACLLCSNEKTIDTKTTDIANLNNEQLLENRLAILRNAQAGFNFIGGISSPLTKAGKLTESALKNSVKIAGEGYSALKQAGRLVKQYGGEAKDWFKKTTKHFFDGDGKKYQIHYYQNEATGIIKEGKIKYPDGKEIKLDQ